MSFKQRHIKPPLHISDMAQAVLNKPQNMRFANIGELSKKDWAKWRDKSNSFFAPNIEKIIKAAPVTIRPVNLGSVPGFIITPETPDTAHEDKLILHLHGGGYMLFGGEISIVEGTRLSVTSGLNVIVADYRVTPEHLFPAAYDDALTAYKALLETRSAAQISIQGTSAGGGLAAALIIAARDAGLPLPASAAFNTPWTDLTGSSDSYKTLAGLDPVLQRWEGGLEGMAKLYAGKTSRTDPRLSPIFSDFSGTFPPSVLISGTRDLFLSDTVRLHRALRQAGHISELHVFEAGWHAMGFTPEADEAAKEMTDFMKRHFDK